MTGVLVFEFVAIVLLALAWRHAETRADNHAERLRRLESATSRPMEASVSKRLAELEANAELLQDHLKAKANHCDLAAQQARHLRLAEKVDRHAATLHGLFAAADLASQELEKQP